MANYVSGYYAGTPQINKNYISTSSLLDQREILNKILDITNEESSFLDIMELAGRSEPTSVPVYHHFLNTELFVLGNADAVTTSSGTTITFTLDTVGKAYCQLGDLIMLKNGNVGYVTAINKSTGVTSAKSVDNRSLAVAIGDKIAFLSRADGEGSVSPDSRRWQVQRHVNQVQTFKEKFQITDIQKASKVEVEFNGKPFYMYKGQHDSLLKFRANISNALMFGQMSATSTLGGLSSTSDFTEATTYPITPSGFAAGTPQLTDPEGNPVQTTMGLDQYCRIYGQDINSAGTSAAAVALTDVASLTQSLNKLRAPQDYFLFVGTDMNIKWDNLLNGLGNSAVLSSAMRFMINGKNLDLGIDTFKIYGRTYHKKLLPLLDHPYLFNQGSTSTNTHYYNLTAYGVPAGKQKTTDGQTVDRIKVRYLANDGTDLRYREILLGGLAPVPTNERSVLEIHYQSTQGLQVLGANHLFKFKTL